MQHRHKKGRKKLKLQCSDLASSGEACHQRAVWGGYLLGDLGFLFHISGPCPHLLMMIDLTEERSRRFLGEGFPQRGTASDGGSLRGEARSRSSAPCGSKGPNSQSFIS